MPSNLHINMKYVKRQSSYIPHVMYYSSKMRTPFSFIYRVTRVIFNHLNQTFTIYIYCNYKYIN